MFSALHSFTRSPFTVNAVNNYPHPIIAREGWLHIVISVALAVVVTAFAVGLGAGMLDYRIVYAAVLPRSPRARFRPIRKPYYPRRMAAS